MERGTSLVGEFMIRWAAVLRRSLWRSTLIGGEVGESRISERRERQVERNVGEVEIQRGREEGEPFRTLEIEVVTGMWSENAESSLEKVHAAFVLMLKSKRKERGRVV